MVLYKQMERYIFSILIALLTLPVFAQRQAQAKVILDKTASAFEKAGGIQAQFNIAVYSKDRLTGEAEGMIRLKGDRFMLRTDEAITWFDGKTQWSYLAGSEEVNVSNPTTAELQSVNPYALLQIYHQGFNYKLGPTKKIHGKSVYEVVLTATDRKQEMSHILLYVAQNTYEPLFIQVERRDKTRSDITVTDYRTGQKYADSVFVFDKKQYPQVEIIDLR